MKTKSKSDPLLLLGAMVKVIWILICLLWFELMNSNFISFFKPKQKNKTINETLNIGKVETPEWSKYI